MDCFNRFAIFFMTVFVVENIAFFRIEVVIMRLTTTYKSYKYWSISVCVLTSVFVGIGYFSWFLMDMFGSFCLALSGDLVGNPFLSFMINYGPSFYLIISYMFVSMNAAVLLEEKVGISWWKGYVPFYRWFLLGKYFLDAKYWYLVSLSFVPFIGVIAKIIILFLLGKRFYHTTFQSILISVVRIIFLTRFVFSKKER